ncbi:uroporphyrin-III C-methyltransferase [Microbotryomycetes sp. JL221]|nr:uroporphyrin-III C-methyltransferase [Microbotryomycetes sp. JL221]
MTTFANPQPGASMLLGFSHDNIVASSSPRFSTLLVLAPTRISSLRAFAALEAGYKVVVGANPNHTWDKELAWRRDQGQVDTINWNLGSDALEQEWSQWFDTLPQDVMTSCMMIVLGDTMPLSSTTSGDNRQRRTFASAQAFAKVARQRRFLVNVADAPQLSDFSWPATHRFVLQADGVTQSLSNAGGNKTKSPLQLAVTTNSTACRLATRIRREVVASLPSNVGNAVLAVSRLRSQLVEQQRLNDSGSCWEKAGDCEEVELSGTSFNRPVEQLTREKSAQLERELLLNAQWQTSQDSSSGSEAASQLSTAASSVIATLQSSWSAAEAQRTRMRYVAQLSEYWPLDRLATVDMTTLSSPSTPIAPSTPGSHTPPMLSSPSVTDQQQPPSQHFLTLDVPERPSKGRIFLLGTGTGSTLLLTRLAHLFLTTDTSSSPFFVDLFLSDKLVPAEILSLIPSERRQRVVIAKKYPGNAEHAQDELMRLAVEAASNGQTVLRMKQGDPFLYGRGGEEVIHFRKHGFEPVVIPGLSSCLAGPTICGIPVTQRGVAETMSVCTGVGRGGRQVGVDGYERGKTLTVLMGVARLEALVESLLNHPTSKFPRWLPIALIERASSPDQRVVAATIETLSDVLKRLSPHRPPGMLVIGWSVMCLEGTDGQGDMSILDNVSDELDQRRVSEWLGPAGYRMREGLGDDWRKLVEGAQW